MSSVSCPCDVFVLVASSALPSFGFFDFDFIVLMSRMVTVKLKTHLVIEEKEQKITKMSRNCLIIITFFIFIEVSSRS